ncbi:MAG: ORF6N domain-containing protein [Limisphaerales bacterium]
MCVGRPILRSALAAGFGGASRPPVSKPASTTRRVILDSDLTRIYGVETRALNQARKRNWARAAPASRPAGSR